MLIEPYEASQNETTLENNMMFNDFVISLRFLGVFKTRSFTRRLIESLRMRSMGSLVKREVTREFTKEVNREFQVVAQGLFRPKRSFKPEPPVNVRH